MALHLRALTEEESKTIKKWSQSRTEEARLVERAQIIRLASESKPVPEIAEAMGVNEKTVRKWLSVSLAPIRPPATPISPSIFPSNSSRPVRSRAFFSTPLMLPWSSGEPRMIPSATRRSLRFARLTARWQAPCPPERSPAAMRSGCRDRCAAPAPSW